MNASQPHFKLPTIETGLSNYQKLINSLLDSIKVVRVDPDQDVIQVMTEWTQTYTGYDPIHVLDHGSNGAQQLGSAALSFETLSRSQSQFSHIGNAFTKNSNRLLYDCHVAAGQVGADLIGIIMQTTRVDIAASDDLIGAENKSMDWILEASNGKIKTS